MQHAFASKALVIGVSGLGVEIAKNCILAGIQGLTLCDPSPATWFDLGGNFYLSDASIGKPRAEVCKDSLAQLNPYVNVEHAAVPDLSITSLAPLVEGMTVVVVTIPLPKATLIALNEKCREAGACFIYSLLASC